MLKDSHSTIKDAHAVPNDAYPQQHLTNFQPVHTLDKLK